MNAALRNEIVATPLSVGLHRAETFTRVFREHDAEPWVVRKATALAEYLRTVPLYLRSGDRIAGSISEAPGAIPVIVELGIGENPIYTGERPDREGYLAGAVPDDIRSFWMNRNAWGRYRTEILGEEPYTAPDQVPRELGYKFLSNQGHLSPDYRELLDIGITGVLDRVTNRIRQGCSAQQDAFLRAATIALTGLSEWITRYADFVEREARGADTACDRVELAEACRTVATGPPATFREALQLVWFVHQAIHVEGHGYSCTPDRLDQLLLPFYEADRATGRIDDEQVLRLLENFVLKQYDNGFWGPEHHLTQGLCVGGSDADGTDLTNRLSWLFVEAHTNLGLPEPLLWVRWHPGIDPEFMDFCLSRLATSTCFPMFWNDLAVPAALVELGIDRIDAQGYVPVGCNELAIPGTWYFNPAASCSYLTAVEAALTGGAGYHGQLAWTDGARAPQELAGFDEFAGEVGRHLRRSIEESYAAQSKELDAQIRWGTTPLTSCFFHGCIELAHDMSEGTRYNHLSCGGIGFANAVDSLAAIREVVFERRRASLVELATACRSDFAGREPLRSALLAAPKHGTNDHRLDDIVALVERMRDEPMREICRDPRGGSRFGNCHVVRSAAVRSGRTTPATPDGRRAGEPLASSVGASVGTRSGGPTALLGSVCRMNSSGSWQCGYQVNVRFRSDLVTDRESRRKLGSLLAGYFRGGGQELQINVVGTAVLRDAMEHPDRHRDLVVRVAGFSEFFVSLTRDMQEEILAREEFAAE